MGPSTSEATDTAKPRSARQGSGRATVPPLAWGALGLIALIALALGGTKLVPFVRERVHGQTRFQIPLGDIRFTPMPLWVQSDLLTEIQFLSGLPDTVNTLDSSLAGQIRDAFALHPWVREVQQVRVMRPGQIGVQLTYREPVAMVRTARSLEPIDRDAVLLPAKDLLNPQLYLVVSGVRSTPTGPVGTCWEDAAVAAAAATADSLSPHHRMIGLTTIDVSAYRVKDSGRGHIYLLTEQGTRVNWGRPPNIEVPGEPSTQDKIERLRHYVADHGSLDAPAGPYEIDVTHWQEISVRPRGQ
jgi:hypothetical protein